MGGCIRPGAFHEEPDATVLGILLVIGITWPGLLAGASDQEARLDLRWLGEVLHGRQALVEGGHIYRYYLGGHYTIRPITVSYQGDSLTARESGRYRVLTREYLHGRIVVIQKGRPRFFAGPSEGTLLGGCSRIDRRTVRVYDCTAGQAGAAERAGSGFAPRNAGNVGR